MENNNDVAQDSSPETEVAPFVELVSEDVNTPTPSAPKVTEEKVVPYERFKQVNDELSKLKQQPARSTKESSVDALDFIKLGKKLQNYSDDEIDFATEHAKSKSPEAILSALDNEMVQLAIQAKRAKVEKEKLAIAPSNAQSESDIPRSLTERLKKTSSLADKEKLLAEAGLYKTSRPRTDRRDIGGLR